MGITLNEFCGYVTGIVKPNDVDENLYEVIEYARRNRFINIIQNNEIYHLYIISKTVIIKTHNGSVKKPVNFDCFITIMKTVYKIPQYILMTE